MSLRPLWSQSGHECQSNTVNVEDRHMVMGSLATHWGSWRWAPEMNWSHRRVGVAEKDSVREGDQSVERLRNHLDFLKPQMWDMEEEFEGVSKLRRYSDVRHGHHSFM